MRALYIAPLRALLQMKKKQDGMMRNIEIPNTVAQYKVFLIFFYLIPFYSISILTILCDKLFSTLPYCQVQLIF
jgi:hypothetical protein